MALWRSYDPSFGILARDMFECRKCGGPPATVEQHPDVRTDSILFVFRCHGKVEVHEVTRSMVAMGKGPPKTVFLVHPAVYGNVSREARRERRARR